MMDCPERNVVSDRLLILRKLMSYCSREEMKRLAVAGTAMARLYAHSRWPTFRRPCMKLPENYRAHAGTNNRPDYLGDIPAGLSAQVVSYPSPTLPARDVRRLPINSRLLLAKRRSVDTSQQTPSAGGEISRAGRV